MAYSETCCGDRHWVGEVSMYGYKVIKPEHLVLAHTEPLSMWDRIKCVASDILDMLLFLCACMFFAIALNADAFINLISLFWSK